MRRYVRAMTDLVASEPDEAALLAAARPLLATLIGEDGWLAPAFAEAGPDTYRQYLLHCDPLERFSVVSFVWGPGHRTPIHDHTVWGLVGVLRGAEQCVEYRYEDGRVTPTGQSHRMDAGAIDAVSPTIGDWHVVSNARTDGPSVSIHVYGGNIGAIRRHRVDDATGEVIAFVSGYSSPQVPNLWDRSRG
ncbi:MAG: cysteine dioxygenase [Lautropia sp.]